MFNIQFKKNLIEKMNKSLFYKERKRMQRLFHSFEKNGCPTLLICVYRTEPSTGFEPTTMQHGPVILEKKKTA